MRTVHQYDVNPNPPKPSSRLLTPILSIYSLKMLPCRPPPPSCRAPAGRRTGFIHRHKDTRHRSWLNGRKMTDLTALMKAPTSASSLSLVMNRVGEYTCCYYTHTAASQFTLRPTRLPENNEKCPARIFLSLDQLMWHRLACRGRMAPASQRSGL